MPMEHPDEPISIVFNSEVYYHSELRTPSQIRRKWIMTTSLITGGAGFVGSHLAELLIEKGEDVIVLDNLSTGSFENIRHLVGRRGFSYVVADISETAILEQAIERAECIYHLAAAVGVQLIVEDPVHTIETNIQGSESVLRAAMRRGKRVLISSTSEVYGKANHAPFAEDDDVSYGPTSKSRWSYAFSKAIDEFLALAYHESKGLPVVIVRLFNTVGPRQIGHYGMVVPRFIEMARKGGPILVYGDGEQSRCFCHVLDVTAALYNLMHCSEAIGQVINVGNDEEITINNLAERIKMLINPSIEIRHISYEEAYRPGFEDMRRRVPSLEKVKRLISYRPKYSLEDILRSVIQI